MEKITSSDIMLGNWFIGYDNKPFKWEIEHFAHLTTVYPSEIIKSAIPLTEDILLKAGFERNKFTKYPTFRLDRVDITHVEFFDEDSEGKEFSFKEWKLSGLYSSDLFYFKSYSPNIKHLHQLQNLFKSLTGNDLTI